MSRPFSQQLLRRVQLAIEDPTNFSIQYPIRREHFQDSFIVGPTSGDSEDSDLNGAANVRVRRFNRRRAGRSRAEDKEGLLSAKQLPVGLPLHYTEQQLPSLYVHVPFCAAKCFYCNFSVDTRKSRELHSAYVDAVLTELDSPLLEQLLGDRIVGIDIGGGTPTLLDSRQLERLLKGLEKWRARCTHPLPISIESTPAVAASDLEKLRVLLDGGVDRVSIGLQSANEETLKSVNRSAQIATGDLAVRNLQNMGFARVCADLIFGLPEQLFEHWQLDLQRVRDYQLDTITTYDCIYKGRGRAFRTTARSSPSPSRRPSWEVYGALYDEAYHFLTGPAGGYHNIYGSVNFSRRREETGTSAYFERRLLDGSTYVGVGNYASSMLAEQSLWWFAPYTVDEWLHLLAHGHQLPLGDVYLLPKREHMAKYILASLSFGRIDPLRFHRLFNEKVDAVFREELDFAVQNGMLFWDAEALEYRVVPGEFRSMPTLRSLFISDHFVHWSDEQSK